MHMSQAQCSLSVGKVVSVELPAAHARIYLRSWTTSKCEKRPVRFKTRRMASGLWFVSSATRPGSTVDHAAEFPPPAREVQRNANLVVLVGWSLLTGLVRAVPVVMAGVLAQDRAQLLVAVEQHPVSALGSRGAYPPLGVAVRPRGPRRGLHYRHALAGEDRVEDPGEFGVRKRKQPVRSPRSMIRLRTCWAVHAPVGRRSLPERAPVWSSPP